MNNKEKRYNNLSLIIASIDTPPKIAGLVENKKIKRSYRIWKRHRRHYNTDGYGIFWINRLIKK